MTKRTTVVSFKNVTKKFGRFKAVEDVTFDVFPGEIVGFVGVNGAGKTTTINMLLGFTSASKGSVAVFGERISPSHAHMSHQRMGYAAGDMELPLNLTGQQYIDFVLAQAAKDHTKQRDLLIKQFKPQLTKKIGTMSRGNKQKIALIAAFVTEPELVVLDEPTSGLDPIMQDVFLELVRRERTKGTTVFMSSHYLQEVAEVCTRVLLMKNGQIVEDLSQQKLSKAGGKFVRVVTDKPIEVLVEGVRDAKQENDGHHYVVTTFVYSGKPQYLAAWVGNLHGVSDLEIGERTLEAEFRDLYDDQMEGDE